MEDMEVDYGEDDPMPEARSCAAESGERFPHPPTAERFQGASIESSRTDVPKHSCSFCNEKFALASMVGFVLNQPPDYPFAVCDDTIKDRACTGVVKLDVFKRDGVRPCCAACAQEFHKPRLPYIKVVRDPNGQAVAKVTSQWTRLKAASRGMKINKKHEESAFLRRDDKLNVPKGTTAKIYETLKDAMAARACDWITVLGGERPFMWILWGCAVCQQWTICANSWYRCHRRVRTLEEGHTNKGVDDGHWRCAGCFEEWSWALAGDMRMIVIGDGSPDKGFASGDYSFSLIGEISTAIENKIKFLKGAALLKALDGKEVTYQNILGALSVLHRQTSETFSKGMPEVSVRTSCFVTQEKLDTHNIDIVSEHSTLSLRSHGVNYQIIDRRSIKGNVSVIDQAWFEYLLDVASSAYDVDGLWPTLGEGGRKTYWSVVQSEGFKDGRTAIRQRL